jgi:membrane-associated phospholipid phosphatase
VTRLLPRAAACLPLLGLACGRAVGAEERPGSERPKLSLLEAQVVGAIAGLSLGAGLGEHPAATAPPIQPLDRTDAILVGASAALLLSPRLFDRGPGTEASPGGSMDDLNGFDRTMRRMALGHRSRASRELLDNLSSGTLTAALLQPVGLLAASEGAYRWSRDAPVIAEATVLSISVNVAVKHLVHRSRPIARFCDPGASPEPCPVDSRLSFYSGHTSSAFAAAVATGSLADIHHLANRKWIWGTGLTLAMTTGVLRVMSDEHYATDVLAGMAAGSLAGWLVPRLHKPEPRPAEPPPARLGAPAAALVELPLPVGPGRSTTVLSGGVAGGGPYVRVAWRW